MRERPKRDRRVRTIARETLIGDLFFPKCTVVPLDLRRTFYPEDAIIKFLSKLDYGIWIEELHDCEDQAILGMASIRNNPQFYGAPVGIAIGYISNPDEPHAVIIYWTDFRTRKYWDPATKSNVEFHPIKIIA